VGVRTAPVDLLATVKRKASKAGVLCHLGENEGAEGHRLGRWADESKGVLL